MRKKGLLTALLSTGLILASAFTSFAGDWKQDDKGWWYQEDGSSYPTNQWKEIEGKQYYFGTDGYMLTNTRTPDGYKVGADGVWVQGEASNTNTTLKEGAHFIDNLVTDGNYYYFVENNYDDNILYYPTYLVRYDINLSTASRTVLHTSTRYYLRDKVYLNGDWIYFLDSPKNSAGNFGTEYIYRVKTDGSEKQTVLELASASFIDFFVKDGYFYTENWTDYTDKHYFKINTSTAETMEVNIEEYDSVKKQAQRQHYFNGKSFSIRDNYSLIIRDDNTGRESTVRLDGKDGNHGSNTILDVNENYVLLSIYKEDVIGSSQISPETESYSKLSIYNINTGSLKEILPFEKDANYSAMLRDNSIVYFKNSDNAIKINTDGSGRTILDVSTDGIEVSTGTISNSRRIKIYNNWI